MIGGYQIISLHSTNNVLGTSYSIKGLYKKVKKTIKQIKLEDLIIDSIKMENVFINVHLDGDNYVGTFGLYQITFKSDDTYTIEENSSGSSGLYFVTTDSYTFPSSTKATSVTYDDYPNLKKVYEDKPQSFILTKARQVNASSIYYIYYVIMYKIAEDTYASGPIAYGYGSSTNISNIYMKFSETLFTYGYSL